MKMWLSIIAAAAVAMAMMPAAVFADPVQTGAGPVRTDASDTHAHQHAWCDPVWNWADDGTCTATFVCKDDCSQIVTLQAAVTRTALNASATVEFNGRTYVCNTPVNPAERGDIEGALVPKVSAKGRTAQKITWTPLSNIDGYLVYAGRAGKSLKLAAERASFQTRSCTVKGLKTGKVYQYRVAAYRNVGGEKQIVRKSVTAYAIAGGKSSKYTDVKSVCTGKHTLSLKQGGTYTVHATVKKVYGGLAYLPNASRLRYLSCNEAVATVSKSGTITAKSSGTAAVYVIGINGASDRIRVTVR